MWTPLLPSTSACAMPSSRRRVASLHGPVAFTITRASTSPLAPLARSCTCAPVAMPLASCSIAVTAAWFSVTAPDSADDATLASVRRTSSVLASQYCAPPSRPSARSDGSRCRMSRREVPRCWPTLRKSESASYASSPARSFQRGIRAPLYTGHVKRSGRTRCGAIVSSVRRSRLASNTRCRWPCSRYRTPPCTRREERDEVPLAQSSDSSMATLNPRSAASRATPAPVIPPPTTSRSNRCSNNRCHATAREARPSVGVVRGSC